MLYMEQAGLGNETTSPKVVESKAPPAQCELPSERRKRLIREGIQNYLDVISPGS